MKKLALLPLLFSTSAFADYRFELTLSGSESSTETTSKFSDEKFEHDNDARGAELTFYFSPVSTKNVPLAEAAFLAKASSLSYEYSRARYNGDILLDTQTDKKIALHTVIADRAILGVFSDNREYEADDRLFRYSNSHNNWGVYAGAYLTDSSTLTLSVTKHDSDFGSLDGTPSLYSLRYNNLIAINSQYLALYAAAGFANSEYTDNTSVFEMGLAWYFNNHISTGVEWRYYSSDDYNAHHIRPSLDYHINENVAVSLAYAAVRDEDTQRNDREETERDTYELELSVRF